jgi:biofilm PGA synthesis protein PgaD
MNEYIINSPQLQSFNKRISGLFVLVVCWLMWVYLLFPLVTLSSWLLGDHSLSNQMRWFGGYKSLLELLEIYFETLIALAILWLCWVAFHAFRKHAIHPAANYKVNDNDLCSFYHVNEHDLLQCRSATQTTVLFNDNGHIVQMRPVNKIT